MCVGNCVYLVRWMFSYKEDADTSTFIYVLGNYIRMVQYLLPIVLNSQTAPVEDVAQTRLHTTAIYT